MSAPKPSALFVYWKNGNTPVDVHPDPPEPGEAKPFHVAIFTESWIPVSILVFARDAGHALSRVRQALVTCRDGQYVRTEEFRDSEKRTQKFIDAIDNGTMTVTVKPLDTQLIVAKVNWASNGDLL